MTEAEKRVRRFTIIILGYPVALILGGILLNLFAFGVSPIVVALPLKAVLVPLIITATLLVINHTWLMNSTEITRMKHHMYASREEWKEAGVKREDVSDEGWLELERRHNSHRNATENTVYFAVLATIFCLVTPSQLAAYVWILGFGVGRLGYTFASLQGRSNLRGFFMSVSLVAMYGMAGYLCLGLLV
ncbi:MAPEG family protein [Maritalea porphyrae]|jgi:uncharacterized membrane protein (DUF106 family)|uniref:MAPEG family protein n=1 Tax=Maritalea porphyrae TaxID=880732 RepID=UPI0022AED6FA|nr:MAPEG family protein [Maritalea porphyrae]MCZ4273429.1 MAPEG family protein [Maritalea porphyrae]